MRFFVWLMSWLSLFVIGLSCLALGREFDFKSEWATSIPESGNNERILLRTDKHPDQDNFKGIVFKYFQSYALHPNVQLSYTINDKNGELSYSLLRNSGGDAADQFYCEQALWEATPCFHLTGHPSKAIYTFDAGKNGPNPSGFEVAIQNNNKTANVVMAHIIPASAAELGFLHDTEVQDVRNLLPIKLNKCESTSLKAYRADWINYLSSQVGKDYSRQALLDNANDLLEKYKLLFDVKIKTKMSH